MIETGEVTNSAACCLTRIAQAEAAAVTDFVTARERYFPIEHGGDRPRAAVRVQELFATTAHPVVARDSAARRPLITPSGTWYRHRRLVGPLTVPEPGHHDDRAAAEQCPGYVRRRRPR